MTGGLTGQLEALQNATVMLMEIVSSADSKHELAANDIVTEMVRACACACECGHFRAQQLGCARGVCRRCRRCK